MTANGILQIILYLIVLVALVKPLGGYIARVYQAEPCGLDHILGPLEGLIYRMFGIRPEETRCLGKRMQGLRFFSSSPFSSFCT